MEMLFEIEKDAIIEWCNEVAIAKWRLAKANPEKNAVPVMSDVS